MEMEKITTEIERNEEDKGASEEMLELKTKEEAEPDHYSKLQSTSENIYSEAFHAGSPPQTKPAGNQTQGNVRLYRAACFFLSIICLALLLVVVILGVKLQTGSPVCAGTEETTAVNRQSPTVAPTCSFEECQAHYPVIQSQRVGCQQCADGWLPLGRSCFYLSTYRLSWDESQRNCTVRGGSLAVITSQRLQNFLTKEGNLKYWIGLRHQSAAWTWVNNTVLQQSYWADGRPGGICGMLNSKSPPEKNWVKASCQTYTYFICQLQL